MGVGVVLGQSRNAGSTPATSTGKRTARFSIGTSTNGWTVNDCDYLCDGTDDQVEINAAIQALPSGGGEIVILDGTYNISATINISIDNVTLNGNGNNTVLLREFSSSVINGIIVLSNDNCIISKLKIEGNKNLYAGTSNRGIYITGDNNQISECLVQNAGGYGISFNGSINCKVNKNFCSSNGRNGIDVSGIGSYNYIISNNICTNNSKDGIALTNGDISSIIEGNICIGNGRYGIQVPGDNIIVSGNICNNNQHGIYFNTSNHSIAIGNSCYNNSVYGIYFNTNVFYSNVSSNVIFKSSYASTEYPIYVAGNNNTSNLFSSNQIYGKNYYDGGSNNTWVNNKYN